MNQVPVEHMCIVRIARIVSEGDKEQNEKIISDSVEEAYFTIQSKAKLASKVLVGVTQTTNTESFTIGELSYVLYITSLVGTVVDASTIEAQQRMQQFDPRSALRGRNN